MTILEAIEAVKDSLTTVPEFFYADLNEANIDADALLNSQFPLMIVLPFNITDNPGRSGVLKSSVDFQAFFLAKKADQVTIQYNSVVIENEIVAPMRALARQFFFRMNQHSLIDKEGSGIVNILYQPTYSALDANVHGVFVRATLPMIEGITGCRH
jgi:hypothetical protein